MEITYTLSFAELLDRLTIVELKSIASEGKNEELKQEVNDILHDIQLHLDSTPMNAEMLRGFTILTLVNRFIFDNETIVREADSNDVDDITLLATLKKTHAANSLRAASKKHIQNQRNERVDEKLNYGNETGFWGIKL